MAFREFILDIEAQNGESCRAAALAVFHGYQQLAVSVLQNAALHIGTTSPRSSEIMTLVAMSVAGFPLKRDPTGPQKLWRDMAHKLSDTLEKAATDAAAAEDCNIGSTRIPGTLSSRELMYLRALVSFLCSPAAWVGTQKRGDRTSSVYFRSLNQGSQQIDTVAAMAAAASDVAGSTGATEGSIDRFFGFQAILNPSQCAAGHDTKGVVGIRLSDQIGFACKFLPDAALKKYLLVATAEAEVRGDPSAVLLTGSNPSAYALLQQYIDNTGDLQSVALLSCAMGMMPATGSHTAESKPGGVFSSQKRFQAWIMLYREMLNRERLWIERAKFDVARAEKGRERKRAAGRSSGGGGGGVRSSIKTRAVGASGGGSAGRPRNDSPPLAPTEDIALAGLQAPQLSARCNYCSATFQLSDLLGNASVRRSDWLTKQPASMLCCPMPKCKQPLPRCAICLLPMTVQNPFLYLHKTARQRQATTTAWKTINPFDEWFLWCQTCHHGGHKRCLADWYERHAKCPVSNCSCVCSLLDEGGVVTSA